MALLKCPECERDVSSLAETCPHCGYPMAEFIARKQHDKEEQRLFDQVIPCEFTVPPPRLLVCVKCGMDFSRLGKPLCKCGFGGTEVDYPLSQGAGFLGESLYIYEHDVVPRKIGDVESQEYQASAASLYKQIKKSEESKGRKIDPIPPDPKYFGDDPRDRAESAEARLQRLREWDAKIAAQQAASPKPKCPICGSVSLTKISSVKKAASIALFGIYGMDNTGKTWKCNNCGSRF